MNKLLLLFLTDASTTLEEVVENNDINEGVIYHDTLSIIIWYSVFAISIALLVLYFVYRSSQLKRFHRLQLKVGKEYTKLSTSKNPLTRIPKIYNLVEIILVDIDIIKEKTSLNECDEALNICKTILDKIHNPEILKQKELEDFINDVASLNSKLAEIYSLTNK